MNKLKYIIILMFLAISGCLAHNEEEASESVSFPTGEVLTNESFLRIDLDLDRYNRLYFQTSPSAKRELISEIVEENGSPISVSNPPPKLYRSGDRTAIIIGQGIYKRVVEKEGPKWHSSHARPDLAADYFLRTYLRRGDPLIPIPEGVSYRDHFKIPIPKVPYEIDNVDLNHNVMVTKTSYSSFPEYLVFSSTKYELNWHFDLERTREANHLKPSNIPNYTIDFSVVTYTGGLPPRNSDRDAILAFPGANEIHFQTAHLKSDSWISTECSFTIPNGTKITERYDAILGFLDPSPGYLSVFWRSRPYLWNNWHFVKIGEWVQTDTSGFVGGISRVAFFRIRNKSGKAK